MSPNLYNYFIPYHPFSRVSSDIRYLPVVNYKACEDIKPGDLIFLYGRDTQGKISRIGKCSVRFPITKYSKVPDNEKIYCTDTYCWQIPVKIEEGIGYGFDCKLMQYSGFWMENIPFKPRKIVQFYWSKDFKDEEIYQRFWYIWIFCRDEEVKNQYKRLVVHLYRDKRVDSYRDYRRFMLKKPLKCERCGFELNQETLGTNRFFEIHDLETDFMKPFRKLDYSKLQVLCPNCHALAHNEMIPIDVTDNKKWMQGTSLMFGRYCGWGEHLVKDFNERFGEKKEEDPGPEYTPEEIYSMFSDFCDRCYPLSSDEKHFAVYDSKRNRVRNCESKFSWWHVIDRHLNSVFGELNEVHVSKDNFFIISKESCGKYTIYKPDCETVIIDDEDRSFYQLRCDDAGNLYYGKSILRPGRENDVLHRYMTRYGCTTLDGKILIPFEYNSILTVDEEGFIMVQKGNKYGCVDINNNVLIPIEYLSFYRYFGTNGWPAIVVLNKKKRTCCYLNRKNEIVGTFLADDLWEKRFHIYVYNGLYGVARQFGEKLTEAVYVKINKLSDNELEAINNDGKVEIMKYD